MSFLEGKSGWITPRRATRRRREEDPGPIEAAPDLPATNEALERCNAGDRTGCQALLALLSRFRRGLVQKLRYRREVPEQDAEDAVADVFVRIYEQALAGERVSTPRKWWKKLYWMARSQVSKNRDRARRATPTASCADALLAAKAEENAAVRHDFQVIIERACERLTPRARAILLARVQGFSYKQIAEILGTTPSAARAHYSRACSRLTDKEGKRNAA